METALPYLSILYIGIVFYLFCRLCIQYRQTMNLYQRQLKKANPELRVFVRQLAEQMGIKKDVRLWLSELVDTPLTIGFWKPIILLPIATINQLSLQQAEAIILHELNHIRQNDYMINLLLAFSEVVMFFNPFARVLAEVVRREREHSCDDMVLQFRYNAADYANALLLLERNRLEANTLAVAATGKGEGLLLNRVKRILTKKQVTNPLNQKMLAYLLSFCVLGFIGWYNPGNVIAKQIQKVEINDGIAYTEEQPLVFQTTTSSAKSVNTDKADETNEKLDFTAIASTKDISEEQLILDGILEELEEETRTYEAYQAANAGMATFVNATQVREFSMTEAAPIAVQPSVSNIYPYVPSQSFSYHFTEDTAMPKKQVVNYSDLQAKEALEKALKGLQELDWLKLEKELNVNGKKVDIIKLQQEIKKAIEEVDWKKINMEVEGSLQTAQEELLRGQEEMRLQLERHQKEHKVRMEQMKKAKEVIVIDRLENREECEKVAPARKTTVKKKIVHI